MTVELKTKGDEIARLQEALNAANSRTGAKNHEWRYEVGTGVVRG